MGLHLEDREFKFTDRDFNHLRDIILSHTGITLSDNKRELVYGRLARRIRALKLNDFESYCRLIESPGSAELPEFINAITTNLTSFFREKHHFVTLGKTVIPELVNIKSDNSINIWSSGCSTGEEPYSLAMTCLENLPKNWHCKILATDLDSNVLATAKNGIYNLAKTENLEKKTLKRWFYRGKGTNVDAIKTAKELQAAITFNQLNLMNSSWPINKKFDVIFCRNVIIYFSKDTQRVLINRYADQLVDNGYLFIGHSESLFKVSDRFEKIGQTTYQKIS